MILLLLLLLMLLLMRLGQITLIPAMQQ